MANPIKKAIFEYQLNKCHKQYEKRLAELSDPYKMWIDTIEDSVVNLPIGIHWDLAKFLNALTEKDFDDPSGNLDDTWICVALGDGRVSWPSEKYADVFAKDSDVALAYADEDLETTGQDGLPNRRFGAWMKPDMSPDTLLSFFYFGSVLFINKKYLRDFLEADISKEIFADEEALHEAVVGNDIKNNEAHLHENRARAMLYDFVLRYTEFIQARDLKVAHIPQVLYHGLNDNWQPEDPKKPEIVNEAAYWGYEPIYDEVKEQALKRRGLSGRMVHQTFAEREYSLPVYEVCGNAIVGSNESSKYPLVSVVIPSKDNVDVLTTCLSSFREKTGYPNYEIILVDNGSNDENRARLEELQKEYGFAYIYEPMDFNFSMMCNIGAKEAKGDYILLLNDDMEITSSDWLSVMVGQASLSHVGAVGAKLLYPNTDIIQHVGITNLWVGPAHKLLKEHDDVDYYYGRNVLPYDMIGVTAACLLVATDKYWQVGGLCEDIAVSYNDVDFCFSLHDQGYHNIIRPDVVLYHHESISRGDDALSEQKWDRLLHEKDRCYQRHPHLDGKDPFYGPNLAGFKHKYFCSYLYPYEQRLSFNQLKPYRGTIKEEWYNNCLTVTLEHVRLERKLDLKDERDVYWLEGWAYVLGMDSSRYTKTILLIGEKGEVVSFVPFERYRPDVVDILPEQENVALSGFSCRIKREDLEPGEYKVGIMYKDTCSRQRLYKECDERLVVE